ncbi:MAG: PAC2 family protein, partial [Acidimicrobiia bacterium]
MSFLELEPPQDLRHPALIATFRGWSDGGEAASSAGTWLKEHLDGRRFAKINPEEFYDFTVHRPIVRLVDGIYRTLDWPSTEFFHARTSDRDLILLVGTEPNLKWNTFTQLILDLAKKLGVEILVTLGAFLAPVPHSSEVGIMGTAADLEQAMS